MEPRAGLQFRNALTEWDHVPSRIVFEGRDATDPAVTIAITTYKRSAMLAEAVRSALRQRFDRPVEIIILDNDPASTGEAALLDAVPELAERSFRYFINGENFGVFGNFNRCIQVARGEWLTILNDDDLLREDYLQLMFRAIDRDPHIDGIVCNKIYVDNISAPIAGTGTGASGGAAAVQTGRGSRALSTARMLAQRLYWRAKNERRFKFRVTRKVRPRTFFWGAMLGNGGGFLFRRPKAVEIGGFYPEEYPSADFWFFARFAKRGDLRHHRAYAATISKTPGSITLNSIAEQLKSGFLLQKTLVGSETPRWWGLLLPAVIAHGRAAFVDQWGVKVQSAELERELGIRVPPHRPWLIKPVRFLLGGEF